MSSLKFKVFLVYEELEYGVLLPNHVNYSNLVRYVKKKFNVGDRNQISLSYNIGSNSIYIIDDDDVSFWVNEVSGEVVKKLFIKLAQQTNEVTQSSIRKPLDIDLNVSLFPNLNFIKDWKKHNLLMSGLTPPQAPRLITDYKHNNGFVKHYIFDDKEAYIYEIALKCLKKGYQFKVLKSCTIRPKDIAHDVNIEWNVRVSYKQAWRGKHKALALSQGCPIESFAHLPFYYFNLKMANEGTVTAIEMDAEGRFKMCFIGFGVAIKSFLCYMRSLIIIDAAHLKGTYLGTNLVAVAMDGSNQIIPIATSVSQGKTGESWA
ncbi:hypothetical protein Tco_0851225 [Tanacetum coccineum]